MGEATMDEMISMSERMADDPIAFFRALSILTEQEDELNDMKH